MPSAQAEDMPSSPIADNGSATSSFFAQEANPQHLLPMINEVDEDAELANAPTTNPASLFFAGRYVDGSGSRKRPQRTDNDVEDAENVVPKRFKSEQVGSQLLSLTRRLVTMVSQAGVLLHKQTATIPLRASYTAGTTQDETA